MAFLFWGMKLTEEERTVKTRARFVLAIVALMLFVAPMAIAAPKDEAATVGWFLKEIASARGLSAPSEAGAAQVLKAAGIAVPALDPTKTLTEGDVVAIGRSVGFTTTTQTPGASLTRTRARSVLTTFQSEIGGSGDGANAPRDAGGEPNENSNNGKGKKKGHNKSPSEPL